LIRISADFSGSSGDDKDGNTGKDRVGAMNTLWHDRLFWPPANTQTMIMMNTLHRLENSETIAHNH
jgi:hypothetical protein